MTGTIAGFTSTGIDDNATSTAITIDASENVSLVGSLRVKGQNLTHSANTMVIGQEGGGLTQFRAYGPDASTEGAIQFNTSSSNGSVQGEVVRITTDGLTFNGDTAAANALDDYETGTFTPTMRGSVVAGTTQTYNQQSGYYTKVGNLVTCTMSLSVTSVGDATGSFHIYGLPFSAGSGVESAGSYTAYNGLTYGTNVGQYNTFITAGRNFLEIRGTRTDGAVMTQPSVAAIGYARTTISYRV
jgi:hypothetical protein